MNFTNAISPVRIPVVRNLWLKIFLAVFTIVWADSLLGTTDPANWLLENALVFGFVGILFSTYKKHQLSDLSYLLICAFLCLHVYGAKHSYAENPLGYWLQEVLHTGRNHYDRIVHFSFGFLLTYPMREVFLRWAKFPKWVAWLLPIEITLSVSGFYELIEWAVAEILFPSQGPAYLGTQGDAWDAQKDIFLAFSGAILATTLVSVLKRAFRIYEK